MISICISTYNRLPHLKRCLKSIFEGFRGKDYHFEVIIGDGGIIYYNSGSLQNKFVYELKVPLKISDLTPNAIGASPGDEISIGFENPKIDPEKIRERTGGRRMGRGPGVGMRGGNFGGGMNPKGQKPEMPEPLDVWMMVKLAKN